MRTSAVKFLAAAVLASLRHPSLVGAVVRRRLAIYAGRRRMRMSRLSPTRSPTSVLSHVAIEPAQQGLGCGTAMVTRFAVACRNAGSSSISLATTDDNSGPAHFYAQRGWKFIERVRTFDGHALRIYDLNLTRRRLTACERRVAPRWAFDDADVTHRRVNP